MAQPKFTLYKHIKVSGKWRYFRAALSTNNKVKPHVMLVGGKEEKYEDGRYCVRHKNQWIDVGNDPAEALRQRTKLMQTDSDFAFLMEETGEYGERRLNHSDGEAEQFYRDLQVRGATCEWGWAPHRDGRSSAPSAH